MPVCSDGNATGQPTEVVSDHEAKRLAIIEGAAAVFGRRGFAAGTTKEIAAEVGLSQPTIYHYVGSKHGMLREIALHVDTEMTGALARGLARSANPVEQLRAVIEEFTDAVVRDRQAFAVYWQEIRSLDDDVRKKLSDDERAFVAAVAKLVALLQDEQRLPDGPAVVVAEAILSMPSWMYHWYRPQGPLSAAQIAQVYCRLIGLDPI